MTLQPPNPRQIVMVVWNVDGCTILPQPFAGGRRRRPAAVGSLRARCHSIDRSTRSKVDRGSLRARSIDRKSIGDPLGLVRSIDRLDRKSIGDPLGLLKVFFRFFQVLRPAAAGGGPSGRLAAVGGPLRPIAAEFLAAPTPWCGWWGWWWWWPELYFRLLYNIS